MKYIKILFFVALLSIFSNAQDAGKTGLSFLKISSSARNAAIADIANGIENDLASVFYNPSLITSLKTVSAGVTYNKWLQDASYSVFNANGEIAGVPVAISLNSFSVPGIEIRVKPGEPMGNFNAQYFSGSIVTGLSLIEELNIGIGAKFLYEGLFSEEGKGYAFDFGVSHTGILPNAVIGLSVRNIGAMNELKNASTELPSEIRGGGTYLVSIPDYKLAILTGVELFRYLKYSDLKFGVGGEIVYDHLLSARLGYKGGIEAQGVSFGFGINWNSIRFDYAFIPMTEGLGNGNMIGLIYNF